MNQDTLENANRLQKEIAAVKSNLADLEGYDQISFHTERSTHQRLELTIPDLAAYESGSNEDYAMALILNNCKIQLMEAMRRVIERKEKEFAEL